MDQDPDRIQEDDLDVEQDEEHRDHVEAHPEAERAGDVGGQAALVRLALDRVRTLRPDHRVQHCEGASHDDPKAGKHEDWEVALKHGPLGRYTTAPPTL